MQTPRALTDRDLPPEAHTTHHELIRRILNRMAAFGGRISYADFMDMALFEPGVGYYDSGHARFGASGDFVTAPEISPLFSRSLALHAHTVINAIGGGAVLEFGAGAGTMAADILLELDRLGSVPERYVIVERSAALRARQYQLLQGRAPHWLDRVEWRDNMPEQFKGAVFANELLDAFPVQKIRLYPDAPPQEFFVARDGQTDAFTWTLGEITCNDTRELAANIEIDWAFCAHPHYDTEVHVAARRWMQDTARRFARGAIFIIDYGYPHHEYYLAERDMGTIVCYFRHRAHDNPLILAGAQDITAHVDFTTLAEAAHAQGLNVAGFTTQGHFLLGSGIEKMLAAAPCDDVNQLAAAQQIKQLVMPNGMGETFKVLALTRRFTGELPGFQYNNRIDRL